MARQLVWLRSVIHIAMFTQDAQDVLVLVIKGRGSGCTTAELLMQRTSGEHRYRSHPKEREDDENLTVSRPFTCQPCRPGPALLW